MNVFAYLLMGFLVLCAIAVSLSRNLLNSILIYMSYSLIMTSILFFVTLKKIHAIDEREKRRKHEQKKE